MQIDIENEKEDLLADVKMYFKQINSLCDLLLETDCTNLPNFLTIQELAESGLAKISILEKS